MRDQYTNTQNYRGESSNRVEQMRNGLSSGYRDVQAGIKYYTPNQGVNPKTQIQPVIGPRITDQDVWQDAGYNRDEINNRTYKDITESELETSDMQNRNGPKRGLAIPQVYVHRNKNSVVPMNKLGEPLDIGYYPESNWDNVEYSQKVQDFGEMNGPMDFNEQSSKEENNLLNIYTDLQMDRTQQAPVQLIEHDVINHPRRPATVFYNDHSGDFIDPYSQVHDNGIEQNRFNIIQKQEQSGQIQDKQPAKQEKFRYARRETNVDDILESPPADSTFNLSNSIPGMESRQMRMNPDIYNKVSRVPPGQNMQQPEITDQLLTASPRYAYTDEYFKQPNNKLYLQDIQPKLYGYTVEQVPINSNVGITYAPQRAPRVLDQIESQGMAYPVYSRIDPQLVRENGTKGQLANNPERTNWSDEYSSWKAPPGTINFEDIYDSRFNSYGDPYRGYSDVDLGTVQYYYSDIDAYRRPNFITRSNVDFVDYRTPQGQIWPEYNRTASVDDVKSHVENQYEADTLFHRQDMMESLMARRNRESWQQRFAPLRKTNNTHHSTWGAGI